MFITLHRRLFQSYTKCDKTTRKCNTDIIPTTGVLNNFILNKPIQLIMIIIQPEVIYLDEQPWDEKFLEVSPRRLSNRKTQKMEELLTNDTIVKIKLQLSELLHKTIKTEVKLEPPELIVSGIKNEEEEEEIEEIEQKVLLL